MYHNIFGCFVGVLGGHLFFFLFCLADLTNLDSFITNSTYSDLYSHGLTVHKCQGKGILGERTFVIQGIAQQSGTEKIKNFTHPIYHAHSSVC